MDSVDIGLASVFFLLIMGAGIFAARRTRNWRIALALFWYVLGFVSVLGWIVKRRVDPTFQLWTDFSLSVVFLLPPLETLRRKRPPAVPSAPLGLESPLPPAPNQS